MLSNHFRPIKIIAAPGSEEIAYGVFENLKTRLPKEFQNENYLSVGKVIVSSFSNSNTLIDCGNVRGCLVVVVVSQIFRVNNNMVLLLQLLDAIRNAKAADVLLFFSYYIYGRSDKKDKPHISVTACDFARILNRVPKIESVVLLDPHDPHIKHYFDPAADEVTVMYLMMDYLKRNIIDPSRKEDYVVVFPDAGAHKRYEQVPQILDIHQDFIVKTRKDHTERPKAVAVVGDVKGKHCIVPDDEILTTGTAIEDAVLLKEKGAKSIIMPIAHAPLVKIGMSDEELMQRINDSPIDKLIITDSIPVKKKAAMSDKIIVLSSYPLIAETIKRIVLGGSLTDLHSIESVRFYDE